MADAETHEPTPDQIREQIRVICANDPFCRWPARREVLHYIVEASIANSQISEEDLACRFHNVKPGTFDPDRDTAARGRVAAIGKGLAEFYDGDVGKSAPVHVAIRKYRLVARYTEHYRANVQSSAAHGQPRKPLPEGVLKVYIDERGVFQLPPTVRSELMKSKLWLRMITERRREEHRQILSRASSHIAESLYPKSALQGHLIEFELTNYIPTSLADPDVPYYCLKTEPIKIPLKDLEWSGLADSLAYIWRDGSRWRYLLGSWECWEEYCRSKDAAGQ